MEEPVRFCKHSLLYLDLGEQSQFRGTMRLSSVRSSGKFVVGHATEKDKEIIENDYDYLQEKFCRFQERKQRTSIEPSPLEARIQVVRPAPLTKSHGQRLRVATRLDPSPETNPQIRIEGKELTQRG